jgi:NAD(P)-dependent dehydrogenase (short-subunit alcohol dehydrogenase family)
MLAPTRAVARAADHTTEVSRLAMPSLEGKVAFVSGASRGIGAALAARFAARGLSLVLCSRGAPVLPEGPRVVARRLDVRDEAAVEALAAEGEARFGGVDLWINNAGVLEPIRPVRDVPVAAFRDHIDTNLVGVLIGTQCYVRQLRRLGRGGVLVNMSSGAAWKPYAGWGAYCAGKAGVERLTEVVAAEEAASGLRAHSIAPGVVDTEMQAQIRAASDADFPERERFVRRKQTGDFNDPVFVADELLAIAFDPARRPDGVAVRIAFDGQPTTTARTL